MTAPSPPVYFLDSSAMLSYLKGEPEGVIVAGLFKTPGAVLLAHTVNLIEVFYSFGPPSVPQNKADADRAIQHLHTICQVQERNDMDSTFWHDVALVIAERRAMPRNPARPQSVPSLALGDVFGVALARRENTVFVTKDRSEIEPLEQAGLVKAFFIR